MFNWLRNQIHVASCIDQPDLTFPHIILQETTMSANDHIDLLNPSELIRGQYLHQLRQTIHAYGAAQIVLGEVLQNAIDAVVEAASPKHCISITLDLDDRLVRIHDDGQGFPNDPMLLFLGGTRKKGKGKKFFGLVGVGLKVVLFNSEYFRIRARNTASSFRYELTNAYRFDHDPPPKLVVPREFPPDPDPLPSAGTEIEYRFPAGTSRDFLREFLDELVDVCLVQGIDSGFGKTLESARAQKVVPTRFAGLLSAFLQRYSYAGDVLNGLGQKPELTNTTIKIDIVCSNPKNISANCKALFDGQQKFAFDLKPEYLLASEVASRWIPKPVRPGLFQNQLGPGGTNLTRTFKGLNQTIYNTPEDYEKLILNKQGQLADDVDEYRAKLFKRINGIVLTIGRIPTFDDCLPGGSRRVLSANGIVTSHDLDLTRGRNQQYVRCFDLVIDVDAELNYGKSQLTDRQLVGLVRRYINDAYLATIQTAAGNWVGKVIPPDESELNDSFMSRSDLGLEGYTLQKEPVDENDVIALFFELAGRGILKGYRIFGLSQSDQYDSRAAIRRVGDATDPSVPKDDSSSLVVEFKVHAAAVIGDCENDSKSAKDMHLIIAWDEGQTTSTQYGFAGIEHSRYHPKKVFPQVQRYLLDTKTGAEVQVLLLKPIVEKLRSEAGASAGG